MNFFNGKIFNSQSRNVASAALILALASLLSRLLGFLRDRFLAGRFGAGDLLDAYYAAFRIPDLVYNLLVLGTLSAGFVPIFISLWSKEKKDEENEQTAWRFVNNVLNFLSLSLLFLGIIGFLAAPFLVKLITPGFSGQKLETTINLTRIFFLSPLILGISAVVGGVLQARQRFLFYSLSSIFYNLGIILGILFLSSFFGIYGVAFGVILGALAHLLVQCPAFYRLGFRYQWVFDIKNEGVKRLLKLTIPRVLTLATSQLNFLVLTALGSNLAAGSLAIFNLAYNIWTFPLGIFAASLATAIFPSFAKAVAEINWTDFHKNFSAACRQLVFLIVPISVFFWVLRHPLIQIILGTGKFSLEDVLTTGEVLKFLIFGLLAESIILLLVRGFFALEDTKTPFFLSFFSSVLRIGGAWYLSGFLGVSGLALGYSLGSIFQMVGLWIFLDRKTAGLKNKEIFITFLKILLISFLAGFASWNVWVFLKNYFGTDTMIYLLFFGSLAGAFGVLVYLFFARFWRLPEFDFFWQSLKKYLFLENFINRLKTEK